MTPEAQPTAPAAPEIAGLLNAPRLIFSTELGGSALLVLLSRPDALDWLSRYGYSVAIGIIRLDEELADAIQLLQERAVPLIAWLMLPPEQGFAFNSQNYPQALACYNAFRDWADERQLRFEAVGFEIAPPTDVGRADQFSARHLAHRFWIAGENMLYPAARAAYIELVATIHHDGYEVHVFHLPFMADERRAGTSLVQRALEIVDVAADVEVLLCSSSVPLERLGGDLGGALIASYGPIADAIGVGLVGRLEGQNPDLLSWPALRRDLLLAARHTDLIYIDSLEDCVEQGWLAQIALLDWRTPIRAEPRRRALVGALRATLFGALIVARFGPSILAWTGWAIAAFLWLRSRRARRSKPM